MDKHIQRKLYLLIVFALFGVNVVFAAPLISNEELTTVTDTSIIITWRTTLETCTSGIEYGIGLALNTYTTDEGSGKTKNHYLTLSDLYANTTYIYRIFSVNAGNEKTYGSYQYVTTLNPPTGNYLFTFATLSDTQLGTDLATLEGARGRPYPFSEDILNAAVSAINTIAPSFTIIKGNLIDQRSPTPNAQATKAIASINALTGSKYPLPGNQDKNAFVAHAGTTSQWYTSLLKLIRTNVSAEASPTTDSIYNYSFDTNGYHFIILDSVKQNLKGQVDTAWLSADLAANTSKKSFIFMHNVITTEAMGQLPPEAIKQILDSTTADWSQVDLVNRAEFLSILATYESDIVGVFMGQLHDNSRYSINNLSFPFVRTGATIQFPVNYNIYKVYSNGFMQSCYKVPIYTEVGRDAITPEGYDDAYWEQEALGSTFDRNFVVTYSSVTVPPTVLLTVPTNAGTNLALNQPIIITFSQEMLTPETQSAFSISPAISSANYSWNSAKTILTISHANFVASTAYTVTIAATAKAANNQSMGSPYSFSVTTGSSVSTTAPLAVINTITNDMTTDPTPTFTGIATDSASSISNIEFRYASNTWSDWQACTPLDGSYNTTVEAFTFTITNEIVRGEHEIEIRCFNSAGVSTETSFSSYSFYYVGTRPEIVLKANGQDIINSDPIKTNPSFEVTVAANSALTLSNLKLYINEAAQTVTLTQQNSSRTISYAFYNPTLASGSYNVRVFAMDDAGNATTKEAASLLVQSSGDALIYGTPLCYPNPFNPNTQTANIGYSLSKASALNLNIYDISGNIITRKTYTAQQTGGKAGYNEITWDGKNDSGNIVGNGIYLFFLLVDGKVIQNGKGKLTVFK